jgi:hypothetical protein
MKKDSFSFTYDLLSMLKLVCEHIQLKKDLKQSVC